MKSKKLIPLLMLLCFVLFGSAITFAGQSFWGTIWAGQTIYAGEYNVYTSGDNLYVKIIPLYDWKLTEVHVHANVSPPPVNGPGNPKIGKFMWSDEFEPTPDPYTFVIPFSTTGASAGQAIYLAIHVVVVQTDEWGEIIEDETGWGGPCGSGGRWNPRTDDLPDGFFNWGRRWGYCFLYVL